MRLLLDTHALLWVLSAPERLPPALRRRIRAGENEVYSSIASAWEIAIKVALKRLDLEVDSLADSLAASGIQALDVDLRHVARVAQLPLHHRDPFDRMLIAQALCESMTLVSRDRSLSKYGVELLWR